MQYNILGFPVSIINNESELMAVASKLADKKLIAFDTEFDRFRRKYGFNLELIQLFDGDEVYLIQVSQVTDISPLKPIFEDESIRKLVYSGVEDTEALKTENIDSANIYDLQIASKLCDHESNSLVNLLHEVLGVEHTKEKQKSDWSKTVLDLAQITYAIKDVIYLIDLYHSFIKTSAVLKTEAFIEEENQALLKIEPKDHVPKIKQYQRDMFNVFELELLKRLLDYRNEQGKTFNKPPTFVFKTELLDEIVKDSKHFNDVLSYENAPRGFFGRNEFVKRFNQEINSIIHTLKKEGLPPRIYFEKRPIIKLNEEKTNLLVEDFLATLAPLYGQHTALYVSSGLKSFFRDSLTENSKEKYYKYRKTLINSYLEEKNINIKSLLMLSDA